MSYKTKMNLAVISYSAYIFLCGAVSGWGIKCIHDTNVTKKLIDEIIRQGLNEVSSRDEI